MAKNGQLFNSKSEPIPYLRPDLDIIPVEDNGRSYIYFHDDRGYVTKHFALDRQAAPLLTMLDGRKNIDDLLSHLGGQVTADQLLDYIKFLDRHRLLQSSHFRSYAEQVEQQYESSVRHSAVTAGASYPSNPEQLASFLDEAFSRLDAGRISYQGRIKALYAPHIDPRVGLDSYVKAFSAISDLEPARVILLATSHYSGYYPDLYENRPFIVADKNFEMPLGTVRRDRRGIADLVERSGELGISDRDRAHRLEHSIELHLLFMSYLWDHDYEIIPILVRNFEELFYMKEGHLADQVERFTNYLKNRYADDGETIFLVSGDLAHIGKKFGDSQPAAEMRNEVRSFDRLFMSHAEAGEADALLELTGSKYDPYRICGFAPLYSFLKTFPDVRGTVLSYDWWDETERESAVSYASILYTADNG